MAPQRRDRTMVLAQWSLVQSARRTLPSFPIEEERQMRADDVHEHEGRRIVFRDA